MSKFKNIDSIIEYLNLMKKARCKDLSSWEVEDIINDNILSSLEEAGKRGPSNKKRHVGIEIECFTKLSRIEVIKKAVRMNMLEVMTISDDSSIDFFGPGESFEFQIVCEEKNFEKTLKKVGKFLKAIKAQTNESCGVHVHLDMRSRNFKKCEKKLINAQTLLFSLVDGSRRNNRFCSYRNPNSEYENTYSAINSQAYYDHKTIEVRLLQGTTDTKLISNWIKLLITIINSRGTSKKLKSPSDINTKKLPRGLKTYIRKSYKKFDESRELMGELVW